MTPKFSLITAMAGAALVFAVPAWGDSWFNDQQQAGVRVSPDLVDRAVAAKQAELSTMLDAREQSLGAKIDQTVSPLDQRERAFAAKREAQLTSGQYPDVIERAVVARGPIRNPVADFDRFRIDHSNTPVPVSVTSSGREIEWPQIGIGFGVGIGILLMVGLVLALRARRTPPLAH